MQLKRRAALGGLMAAGLGRAARADTWPTDAVTWIVPFAAGGVNDASPDRSPRRSGPRLASR
jgi:tripartite-type tricarboxylate transporter receptor subunit TctC